MVLMLTLTCHNVILWSTGEADVPDVTICDCKDNWGLSGKWQNVCQYHHYTRQQPVPLCDNCALELIKMIKWHD